VLEKGWYFRSGSGGGVLVLVSVCVCVCVCVCVDVIFVVCCVCLCQRAQQKISLVGFCRYCYYMGSCYYYSDIISTQISLSKVLNYRN